jgi:hypothetical protein
MTIRKATGFLFVMGLTACAIPAADMADEPTAEGTSDFRGRWAGHRDGGTDAGGGTTAPSPSPSSSSSSSSGTGSAPPPAPSPPPPAGAIWRPAPGTSWQWQLSGTVDTTVNAAVFDIDLFDNPQATIDTLHAAGRKVICYFDTAYEPNRPDSAQLAPYRGNPMQGWPGEYWVDLRQPAVLAVMENRQTLAQQHHCDGIEADDVDARSNNPGFPITATDQQNFIKALAADAHAKGMSFALKNDLDEVSALVSSVDFAINEECVKYNECDGLAPFKAAGKAVLHTEYGSASLANTVCPITKPLGFSTIIKNLNLDAWRVACP